VEILPGIHHVRFPLAPRIWGAFYVLTGRRPAIIDTGKADTPSQFLFPYLRRLGLPLRAIQLIVTTHRHLDHAGGNASVRKAAPIPIAAHCLEAPFLEDPWRQVNEVRSQYPDDHPYRGLDREHVMAQLPGPVPVDIRLEDGDEIELGDRRWQVVHTPGHCLGIICLFDSGSDTLLATDSFQAGGTADGIAIYGDLRAYLGSLDRTEALGPRNLVVAHPFQPFCQPLYEGEKVAEFLAACRYFPSEYDRQLIKILRGQHRPRSLAWITDVMRKLHGCDGPRFLSVVTLRTHLDWLTTRGILHQGTVSDHLAWICAE
jgi:glyoxylase-like metal-dependent hydrolase (beta-lactamase superfamily II)